MPDLVRLSAESLRKAEKYRENRDRYITSNPDILGGTPVIAGTRISVYSVLGRLQDGDTAEDIAKDYPEISEQAIETAELYAKAHPLRGRPSGGPGTTESRSSGKRAVRLKSAERSVEERGWVTKTPEELLDGFKEKARRDCQL